MHAIIHFNLCTFQEIGVGLLSVGAMRQKLAEDDMLEQEKIEYDCVFGIVAPPSAVTMPKKIRTALYGHNHVLVPRSRKIRCLGYYSGQVIF